LTFVPTIIKRNGSRDAKRRAAAFHKRAAALAEVALHLRDDADRRHYLDLAHSYERSANTIAREHSEKVATTYGEQIVERN
jgi:hypothetical protein